MNKEQTKLDHSKEEKEMKKNKAKKPIYKRVWFWLLVVVVFFGIILEGPEDDNPNNNTGNESALKNQIENEDIEEDLVVELPAYEIFANKYDVNIDLAESIYTIFSNIGIDTEQIESFEVEDGVYGKDYTVTYGSGSYTAYTNDEEVVSVQRDSFILYDSTDGTTLTMGDYHVWVAEEKAREEREAEELFKTQMALETYNFYKDSANGITVRGKFTNNSSETIKYVYIKTYYYNGVMELEQNEIAFTKQNSTVHKLVGPVGPGESVMLNGGGFYSYHTEFTSSFVYGVELMDGTVIQINE